jgi:hypothetical protein
MGRIKMYRNPKLLVACREIPCQLCGAEDGTVVAAHSNQLRDGKGRGLKASDYRIASLCFLCHSQIDQGKDLNRVMRVELWELAHRKTIGELFERGLVKC